LPFPCPYSPEIYTLSLHDALPIYWVINGAKMFISLANHAKVALIFAQTDPEKAHRGLACFLVDTDQPGFQAQPIHHKMGLHGSRSEEHTSELQSRFDLVCRLLLEK